MNAPHRPAYLPMLVDEGVIASVVKVSNHSAPPTQLQAVREKVPERKAGKRAAMPDSAIFYRQLPRLHLPSTIPGKDWLAYWVHLTT